VFAVLHASPAAPVDQLVDVAQAFTPRFQVLGPFVLLDVGGLSALFGTPEELGTTIRHACPACRAVTMAPTASAALLIACGREGLTVVDPAGQKKALAELPIEVLIEVTQARLSAVSPVTPVPDSRTPASPELGPPTLSPAVGWRHPRDTHQAHHVRRPRPRAAASSDLRQALMALEQCAATLRRWGILRLGTLAALPRPEVHARLGALGVDWQHLACGEDDEPLVPWLAEPIFEELLELEWPIEGFEPLAFVLARVLEPLSARLERADRGAVAIRTALHLTNKQGHVRVIPLPAPMRDAKTLRTLVLLDLESHPPAAPIDRVQVRLEPTPGRVLQWTLFDRAQPAPEQVATLVARLTALMGEGRVGSPALLDSWRPGAFAMEAFAPAPAGAPSREELLAVPEPPELPLAFRRYRLPIPVRVRVDDGRPVRLTTDRRGVTGGAIVQAAGPWRTSGAWWATTRTDRDATDRESGSGSRESEMHLQTAPLRGRESIETREGGDLDRECSVSSVLPEPRNEDRSPEDFPSQSASSSSREGSYRSRQGSPASRPPPPGSRLPTRSSPWDRDEWDIAMADGTIYRLFVEREVGQWFLEGVFD
jgi:protein ImuB